MSVEAIAAKWHDLLISSRPIDHEAAEAAASAAYRAAGIAAPEHFLWFPSPFAAAWAALTIIGKTDGYNHATLEDVERSKAGKAGLAATRASLAERLGIAEDAVEGYFGKPFYRAEGASPVTKALHASIADVWMARAQAGDDFLAIHKQGPFKPLHDLDQALHFEGYKFIKGRQTGSLLTDAMEKPGSKAVSLLAKRSAHHRFYGTSLAYSDVAVDEALAEAGKFQPTELQRAMWAAYEACGMWWPCERGVIFSERPVASELTAQGPKMEWSDGFSVGGKPAAKPNAAPQAQPPVKAATKAAGGPLLDRYMAGEHEKVWQEMGALGEAALSGPQAADAAAVAEETMRRVEANVRTIAGRLHKLGYRFVDPGAQGGFFGLRKPKAHQPHVPPTPDASDKVAELEELIGGSIPLSLRAFFTIVGEINFNGSHPRLAPADSSVAPDPLMIYSVDDAIAMVESMDREEDEPAMFEFAPDALHKANVSGGGPYFIELPSEGADAKVQDAPFKGTFIEYLRDAILTWGGFPGWAEEAKVPPEIAELRAGLTPF
jgi:hypothetical protein